MHDTYALFGPASTLFCIVLMFPPWVGARFCPRLQSCRHILPFHFRLVSCAPHQPGTFITPPSVLPTSSTWFLVPSLGAIHVVCTLGPELRLPRLQPRCRHTTVLAVTLRHRTSCPILPHSAHPIPVSHVVVVFQSWLVHPPCMWLCPLLHG